MVWKFDRVGLATDSQAAEVHARPQEKMVVVCGGFSGGGGARAGAGRGLVGWWVRSSAVFQGSSRFHSRLCPSFPSPDGRERAGQLEHC